MRPRVTDWGLALLVGVGFATGLWTLTIGRRELDWVFVIHGGVGFALGILTLIKLRRVRWRLLPRTRRWPTSYRDPRTLAGIASTLLVLLVLLSGITWVHGGTLVAWGYNLLNWHIVASFVLVALVSLHMIVRALPLRHVDVSDRRQALRLAGVFFGGLVIAPLQHGIQGLLRLPGSERSFTGSRELASFTGNSFPTVSWIADNPPLIDRTSWRLALSGAIQTPLSLGYGDVDQSDELIATLDCTGGFYSTQQWRGISVATLLDQAKLNSDAAYVSFKSITGYRWSLPVELARGALLATQLGGEPLTHGHGAPVRLVVPGERGFVWVKWLTSIEVLTGPDFGQLIAINTSSL